MLRRANDESQVGARPARRAASLARWSAAPVLPSPMECLSRAHAGIACVQRMLTNPTASALLRTEVLLREVADRLRQFPKALATANSSGSTDRAALIAAAVAAKEELAHANLLFQRAGHFYHVWIRHFSALRCGYTRTGSPARLTCTAQGAARG